MQGWRGVVHAVVGGMDHAGVEWSGSWRVGGMDHAGVEWFMVG